MGVVEITKFLNEIVNWLMLDHHLKKPEAVDARFVLL